MDALERWATSGYREVLLPSGTRIRGVMPTSADVVRLRLVPAELSQRVMASEARREAGERPNDEDLAVRAETRRIEAALFVRQVQHAETGAWEDVLLTADELNGRGFPPEDVEALEDVITYRKTPEQVTAETQAAQGAISEAEAARVAAQEAAATVDGYGEFRDDGRGPGAGEDRPAVRPAAQRHDRPAARPRRPRARPSSGAAPSAG